MREHPKKTPPSIYISKLLHVAEQRINFIYAMLMIAFEAAILIYISVNTWDDMRFYFGGIAAVPLLLGIIINAVFRKKAYPWIKYINNLIMIFAIFTLCGLSDIIAMLFILLPILNSFYLRPRFTAAASMICLFMMYVGLMLLQFVYYTPDESVYVDFQEMTANMFNFSNEMIIAMIQSRSFLLIIAVVMMFVSVYLSSSSRKAAIRQSELMQKNLSTELELSVARNIQEGILSTDFPDNPSFAVFANMTPATEVGGDFYDYFLIDETHLAVVIGDVSGHGMAAAMFMTLSKTLIKVYTQAHHSPDKVFEQTNRYLQQSNPAKFFVTAWLGILDLSTGNLSYANAGHNFPVILRSGKEPDFLRAKPNFVLGRRRLIRYKENRMKLHPGDKLLLYTDGVTEARSPDGGFFGDEGLMKVISAAKQQNQKEMVVSLRRAVNAFENGNSHYDDATILALSYKDHLQVEPPESKTFFLTKQTFDSVTEYISGRCTEAGCDEAAVGNIAIATSEILANIDSYAYENGGEIEILTKCRDRRMTIVFKDKGKPFNPLLVQEPDVTLPLSQRRRGGLGIFIVKKLMSETGYAYQNGQNVLTIEMDF